MSPYYRLSARSSWKPKPTIAVAAEMSRPPIIDCPFLSLELKSFVLSHYRLADTFTRRLLKHFESIIFTGLLSSVFHLGQRQSLPRSSLSCRLFNYVPIMLAASLPILTTTLCLLHPALADPLEASSTPSRHDLPSSEFFNIINLFSYDQPLAVQSNTVPGGAQNAPGSFIQFYLNDQGNGRNGGCQITWNPMKNQAPPINQTQELEFDRAKTATLRSYQPPGEFVVDIRHQYGFR